MIRPTTPLTTSRTTASRSRTTNTQPAITQADLLHYRELKERLRDYRQLRDRLFEQIRHGATVEPGQLTVTTTDREYRMLSFQKITDAFGRETAENIRRRVTPTTTTVLSVVERLQVHVTSFEDSEDTPI